MKTKILLGIALLLSAWQIKAQTNNLIIFDQQGEPFYAIVNGVQQNATPQTNVKVTGLTGNPVKVTVMFKDSLIPAITKNAYFQDNGSEETYNVVVKKDGEHVLRFMNVVPIAQAPAPVQNQNVVNYSSTPPPPPPTSTTVVQQTTTTTTTTDGGMPANVTMNVNGANVGMNMGGVQQTTVVTTTTTTGDQTQQAPPPPPAQAAPPAPTGCQMPMPHDDYESAKRSITAKDFEDTKLTLAKQINGGNCMSAEQIRGIMNLFTFEQSKLDFAKFAYAHCTDKGNYFKVNDAFQFDHSSKELNDYISGHQ